MEPPPVGNLAIDTAGNLYGATSSGGSTYDAGMIYELSPKGWRRLDGEDPLRLHRAGRRRRSNGSMIFDASGNLYGTAGGGSHSRVFVFELSPQTGGVWTEQVLYTFNGEDGWEQPQAGLIFDKSGNLYGTTESGGEKRGLWHGLRAVAAAVGRSYGREGARGFSWH